MKIQLKESILLKQIERLTIDINNKCKKIWIRLKNNHIHNFEIYYK